MYILKDSPFFVLPKKENLKTEGAHTNREIKRKRKSTEFINYWLCLCVVDKRVIIFEKIES